MTGVVQLANKKKLTYKQQLEMDLNYIKYHTWRTDIQILWKTIKKVV
ncbi:sugar transferase [Virgibacillus salarius]